MLDDATLRALEMDRDELEAILALATPEELKQIDELLTSDPMIWRPLPGPQSMAYRSTADVIGFGGAAGGGKTDLGVGKALTCHRKVAVFRRVGTELTGVIDRFTELLGHSTGYNGQLKIWRKPYPGVQQIEFGSVPNAGDEKGHQGRPKDLLIIDEAANFLLSQVRFLMGWVRSTVKGQAQQTLMLFNPPTNSEGRWIIDFFGPWLDDKHPNPAKPGELRWFAVIKGRDVEVEDNRRFVLGGEDGRDRLYEFEPRKYKKTEIITPQSRTFIPSNIADNPYLYGTGYMTQLQALPEPLRSQMLNGDFKAGMQDSEWQLCPTEWVDAAMARWKPKVDKGPMDQMGVDVARGGKDNTIIARRHAWWFDEAKVTPGKESPDGPTVAGLVIAQRRDSAPVNIDVIGVGASPYDFLREMQVQVLGVNVSMSPTALDASGVLSFFNLRSQLYWQFRELLDPQYGHNIALPPDPKLKADLCSVLWRVSGKTIRVESREEIMDRIQRSPDWASAYILAAMQVPKIAAIKALHAAQAASGSMGHNPYSQLADTLNRAPADYDPYK